MADALLCFTREHSKLFVLTGAGISTASGIPDYRDELGRWKCEPPVMAQDYALLAPVRTGYWARSMSAWPVVARAQPNVAHEALARLQASAHLHCLVTQNVDGLHQRAGSVGVIELHGNVARVACLDCRAEFSRSDVQQWLEISNPERARDLACKGPKRAANINMADLEAFKVPECVRCGGMIKPTTVFFGDTVPKERVAAAAKALEESDAMLVVGSSLMLYSGYRFCEAARGMRKPIAAINIGRTRADHLFRLKVERPCTDALVELVRGLQHSEADASVINAK